MRRLERGGDIASGAETGIEEPSFPEMLKSFPVPRNSLRLDEKWSVPLEAKPAQVLENSLDELWPASRLIEVLDPQEESAAAFARSLVAENRTIGVTKMQLPGW